jgi:hypothetical protein
MHRVRQQVQWKESRVEKSEAKREVGSVAFAVLFVSGALTLAAYCIPEGSKPAEQVIENKRRVFSLQVAEAFAESDEVPPSPDYDLQHHERALPADGFLECGCGGPHAPGDHGEPDRGYAVEGPGDNPDPHLARLRDDERLLPPPFPVPSRTVLVADPDAPTRPWGREASLGIDPLSARGEIWGSEVGDALGQAEDHQRSMHGGAEKSIETKNFDSAEPRVFHSGLVVDGPLRASEVLKPMTQVPALADKCYRAALELEPHLKATVAVVFEVLTQGQVGDLTVTGQFEGVDAPLASPAVVQLKLCLGEGVNLAQFPLRSVASRIKYPLLLTQGG